MDLVLGTRAEYQILLASPEVNGFFGAKGWRGPSQPPMCTLSGSSTGRCAAWASRSGSSCRSTGGGAGHSMPKASGCTWQGAACPVTLIGSPNFGYRSVHRDLEAQIAIVTESRALQQQLHQEQEQLYLRSGVVSSSTFEQPSRQVKLWVKMVTPLIKNFF